MLLVPSQRLCVTFDAVNPGLTYSTDTEGGGGCIWKLFHTFEFIEMKMFAIQCLPYCFLRVSLRV